MQQIKYNLVGNPERGDSLDTLRTLEWEDGIVMCTQHTWVWPLFCQLRMRGYLVSFSYELEKDAINIIHGQVARGLLNASNFWRYFIIGIRADYRPFPYGHFEIVQNETTVGRRRIYMPLCPQPGLIPRDEIRHEVRNICFSGRLQNSVDPDAMKSEIEAMGCRFIFKGKGEWQDMHDVDILLGIRSFSKKSYNDKPATKLFNAWLSGIPFIGGYDSAYEQVGQPGKNYLRVSSQCELMEAIRQLKNDPLLFESIVKEGRNAVQAYTAERTIDRWSEFLDGPATVAYNNWTHRRSLCRFAPAFRGIIFGLYEKGVKAHVHRFVASICSKKSFK